MSNSQQFSDDELIVALEASPNFVRITDSDHLAWMFDVDEDEKAPTTDDPWEWYTTGRGTRAVRRARAENLTLSVKEAVALPQADTYEVGQRVIVVSLPYLGVTVRSVDEFGVGIDYDNDEVAERGLHEALFSSIRPMPHH